MLFYHNRIKCNLNAYFNIINNKNKKLAIELVKFTKLII